MDNTNEGLAHFEADRTVLLLEHDCAINPDTMRAFCVGALWAFDAGGNLGAQLDAMGDIPMEERNKLFCAALGELYNLAKSQAKVCT